MYLVTKLSKRTKTISWFLLHVFVLQVIPFSSFATKETGMNNADRLPFASSKAKKSALIERMLTWSAPVSRKGFVSQPEQTITKPTLSIAPNQDAMKLKAVSSSGGGFTPGSMNDMVDPFTGDFSYSIPLMDVDGYPLTLSYNSNVTMNTEASWVGLGWNLDVGSISREMRGIPDEFNGEQMLATTFKTKKDETNDGFKAGGYLSVGFTKVFLSPKIQVTGLWGNYTNSYLGLGRTFDIGLQASVSLSYSNNIGNVDAGFKFGLGYSSDTKGGVGFNKSFGFSAGLGPKSGNKGPNGSLSYTFGSNFNSRSGLISKNEAFNISAGYITSTYLADSKKGVRDGHSGTSSGASYGASTSVSYGTATSIPRLRTNSISESNAFLGDLYVGFGTKLALVKIGGIVETYKTSTESAGTSSLYNQPAYGYLHTGKRGSETRSYAVMDFDRGADFNYSEHMRDLPFSVQSFDIFHVSSSGLNAQFRANRTDIGTYYDATTNSKLNEGSEILIDDDMKGVNAGVLLGAGITIEVGYSTGIQQGDIKTGRWSSPVTFPAVAAGKAFDPTVYFKAIGEVTPNDLTTYNTLGGNEAANFTLIKSGSDLTTTNNLSTGGSVSGPLNGTVPTRATVFDPKTALEMATASNPYERKIHFYGPSGTPAPDEDRNQGVKSDNDISSIKVISTSGGVYTYGLPNYSLSSSDISFSIANVAGRTYDDSRGEVSYLSGDDGTGNSFGKAEMYDETTVPAYASSYMLTSIVGPDYIDLSNNGPTLDDIGSYHKFDYVKYYGESSPYRWRFPVSGGQGSSSNPKAILNKGYLSLDSDDIATYSYSEREVYYPLSISGKNYIAVFTLEDRKDAYGVSNRAGFLDESKPLKCLDKITLYNLSDYQANGSNAVKLQVVDFEYNYSLCLKAPNNKETYSNPSSTDNGKLTLQRIRTYSGTSKVMGLSAIEFTYNNESDPAYAYNHLNVDRWGNYKANDPNLPNNLYPYAIQNQSIADDNAAIWKLSSITTPSGGEMLITYEADNYGYVQNRRAMRQFQIEGMMNYYQYYDYMNNVVSWNLSELSDEFRKDNYSPNTSFISGQFKKLNGTFQDNFTPNNIIVFKLEHPIDALSNSKSAADNLVKNQYFKHPDSGGYLEELYFNMYVKVKNSNGTDLYEMVPCFVNIANEVPELFNVFDGPINTLKPIGVMPPIGSSTSYEYGYVALDLINVGKIETTKKKENKKDEDILIMNPIQRFGVDFIRQNLPDIVYGACETCIGELSVDKKALFGKEMYKYLIDQAGYLKSFVPARSFVRLFEPDNIKIGGNARVTSIALNDKWVDMSNEEGNADGTYTWAYSYPTRAKSLGVASYEPAIGMDENPFYSWHSYYNFAKKFPDEMNFHVTPLARQLFPDPVVGYEEVNVAMSGGSADSKGKVILKFHTNKETKYSTVAESTKIIPCDPVKEKNIFTGKVADKYGLSQGYSVITNDFHGKPYDITLQDDKANIISNTKYDYYELGEQIPMIDRKGQVTNQDVSQEFDMHLDSRFVYNESRFQMAGLTVGFTYPTFKVSISPYFTQSSKKLGFYSLCLMKHLNYSAIVKKITTTYLGSSNTAENMLYDQYSGEVVFSSLQDEYDDRLYNLVYPSHWAYPSLREIQTTYPASSSGTINSSTGLLTTTYDLTEFYAPGDLISLTNGSVTDNGYILSIAPGTAGGSTAYIVSTTGPVFSSINGPVTFTVKVPNRKNRLSETMQTIVTKKPIWVDPGNIFSFPTGTNEEVLESSVITYKDKDNLSECSPKPEAQYINLFANGAKGDLVMETALSWKSERKQEVNEHKTRFDGAYAEFKPFYALDNYNVWTRIDKANYPYSGNGTLQKWRKAGIPSRYDKFGQTFEMRDPIGIYAAVRTISNNKIFSLPIAQAVNANATDILYDGFESYTYQAGFAYNDYFLFSGVNSSDLTSTVRHSGKTSLKITPATNHRDYGITTVPTCPLEERQSTDIPQGYQAGVSCNCPPPLFNPTPGDYVFSVWIKQTGTGATMKVLVGTNPADIAVAAGPVIEGWQRFEGTCNIPSTPTTVTLKLENSSGADAYFDDFRFHPFAAGMTTTVYDPATFLPMATHDGNNYTTFYNYDENLQLVRVKVETTEGIKTVSETNFGLGTK